MDYKITIPDAAVPRLEAVLPKVLLTPGDLRTAFRTLTVEEYVTGLLLRLVGDVEGPAAAAAAITAKRDELDAVFEAKAQRTEDGAEVW